MDYIVQDKIGVKVDSLLLTDDYFEAKINFKFPEDMKLNSETFSYGFAVYDDQKNVYGVFTRLHIGELERHDKYTSYMYKEIGVEYDKSDIYAIQLNDVLGIDNISAENQGIISKITMDTIKGFPDSKKIYIRVFDLGYHMSDVDESDLNQNIMENFTISDAKWIL